MYRENIINKSWSMKLKFLSFEFFFFVSFPLFSQTWFRAGNGGDRYLHCGRVSAGCITVTDIKKWDEIYKYLIVSRKNSKSVGAIKVVDQ